MRMPGFSASASLPCRTISGRCAGPWDSQTISFAGATQTCDVFTYPWILVCPDLITGAPRVAGQGCSFCDS